MKRLIFLGVGAAVGSAVTFFIVRKYYKDLAFKEISDVREAYKKKYAAKEAADKNKAEKEKMLSEMPEIVAQTKVSDIKTGKTDTFDETINKYLEKFKVYEALTDKYSGRFNVFSNPPNADEIDNGYSDDDDEPDPYELIIDHESPSEGRSEYPFMISEDEFASEKLFYDKVMIEYYDDGFAVLEETNEIIDSIEELIGPYILDRPIEEDTIYVRNDNRSTDYGIIFKGTSFVPEEGLS